LFILDEERQATWVVRRRLSRLGLGQTVVDVPGHLGLLDVDVDQPGIRLTTIEGKGASGYVDQPMQVFRQHFAIGSRLVTDTLFDVGTFLLLPPDSTNTIATATDDVDEDYSMAATDNTAIAPVVMR
jgi:hypothetical protein